MKTKDRDINSYIAIIDSFINKAELEYKDAELIKKELRTYINLKFNKNKWVHPELTKFCTDWYREFYRLVGGKDPYQKLKDKSNQLALKILPEIKAKTFSEKIAFSILGNKIDYGAVLVHNCNLEEIKKDFYCHEQFKLDYDDTKIFQEKLGYLDSLKIHPKKILFLTDNCGEILFDTFLLSEIQSIVGKENLLIMAKESPMLNDATVHDLKNLGFDDYGQIVSTGSNCFGLHKEDISNECKQILKEVDLIIAKGQAYLEFFTEYNFQNVINILIVKYPIVNPGFGVLSSGQKIVMSSEKYAMFGKDYFKDR
jgi:uncharacterized protein with ATP-grasp and redox domains